MYPRSSFLSNPSEVYILCANSIEYPFFDKYYQS